MVSDSLLSAAAVLRPAAPPIYEAQPASWTHVTNLTTTLHATAQTLELVQKVMHY